LWHDHHMSEFGGGAAGPSDFRRLAGEEPLPAELRTEPAPESASAAPDEWDDPDPRRDGVFAEDTKDGVGDLDDDVLPNDGYE
jgi:hypothetical protein